MRKGPLDSWVRIVEGVNPPWNNFPSVRRTRKGADPVGDCVVFNNIKDNDARLITYINYEMGTVSVLIADYEGKHFTIEKASGVEVLKELMDANGLRQ